VTGRPRLPLNTTGEIRTMKVGNKWKALANHRDPDGRTRQYERTAATKTAAINRLKQALATKTQLAEGRGRINSRTRMNVLASDYFDELAERVAQADLSPGTVRLYRSHWDNHGNPALGELAVVEADVQTLDRFLRKLRKHSPTVAKTMRAVLSGMLQVATRYNAIPSNPVRDVHRILSPQKAVRALEPGEAVDLWQKLTKLAKTPSNSLWAQQRSNPPPKVHPYIPDLVLWMLGTSLRISQALAVYWPWIDFDEATAAVGPNIIRVKGEGLRINRGTPKTWEQILDLPESVVAMLLIRRETTINPLGLVFPDNRGGLRDPHNTLGDLRRALDMAGYEWVTSHTFRKTVATVLDEAGLSARQIADQLSHSRPSMTQDRYIARNARNPRAVAAIETMLTTPPDPRRVVPIMKPDASETL